MPKLFSTRLFLDIVKIITLSIFIVSGRFLKREITNFVSFNFASGPEFRLCSEVFGLWLAFESADENKSHVSRHSKNHNSLDFYRIRVILSA